MDVPPYPGEKKNESTRVNFFGAILTNNKNFRKYGEISQVSVDSLGMHENF